MANFRPLQPAPMEQEAPPQPQTRPLLTQKPKRTVTLGACVACRKRKSKCDGNRPMCTCCAQKDTECIYELGPNEKPSQAMKRKNEEMQGELFNLRQLYDFLRCRPEQEAMDILKRIRAKSPETSPTQRIQELADFVRHGDLLMQQQQHSLPPSYVRDPSMSVTLPPLRLALDPTSQVDPLTLPFPGIFSPESEGPSSQRRRYASDADVSARSDSQGSLPPPPTSIEAIVNPVSHTEDLPADSRLASVKNWTAVQSSTHFLVNLLTAWTDREYIYYHYLDREAFLDDMASGRSDFCSTLLVNALLASACFHSSAVKDRQKPFSEMSMTTVFYKEARRLWDLEEGKDTLTKLQAGICLFLVLGKHGRDKDGLSFLLEACRISHNLGLFSSKFSQGNHDAAGISPVRLEKVRAVTAWALFNFQLSMSFTYSIPVVIKTVPAFAIPYQEDADAEALFRSECSKHLIILECVNATRDIGGFHNSTQLKTQRVEACYAKITKWWGSRPASLNPDTAPTKENLLCAMIYHVDIINLFQPLQNGGASPSSENDLCVDRARSVIYASLREIRRYLTLQETRHGWNDAITLVLHAITVASYGSLDEISLIRTTSTAIENIEPYQGLLTCLRALGTLSSYSYYAQPLFRLLTQKCQALDIKLPIEVQGILDYYTSEEWTKNAATLVSSQYIADMRQIDVDTENARMDAIISSWEGLQLDDGVKGKGK